MSTSRQLWVQKSTINAAKYDFDILVKASRSVICNISHRSATGTWLHFRGQRGLTILILSYGSKLIISTGSHCSGGCFKRCKPDGECTASHFRSVAASGPGAKGGCFPQTMVCGVAIASFRFSAAQVSACPDCATGFHKLRIGPN